jgi:hypothetical protein
MDCRALWGGIAVTLSRNDKVFIYEFHFLFCTLKIIRYNECAQDDNLCEAFHPPMSPNRDGWDAAK